MRKMQARKPRGDRAGTSQVIYYPVNNREIQCHGDFPLCFLLGVLQFGL